ncbi:MAG: hypothetical protein ACE5JP_03140 [Candidatus Bipolaricaulia bacterium]
MPAGESGPNQTQFHSFLTLLRSKPHLRACRFIHRLKILCDLRFALRAYRFTCWRVVAPFARY